MKKIPIKIEKVLLLIISIYSISNIHVEALRTKIPNIQINGSSGTYELPKTEVRVGNSKVECEYNPNYGYNKIIDINAYDMQGNSIIPYSHISYSKFKAGTWIGINLREYKYAAWNVSINKYMETYKKYTCNRTTTAAGKEYNTALSGEYQKCIDEANECQKKCDEEKEKNKDAKCVECPKCQQPNYITCNNTSVNLEYYHTATLSDCPSTHYCETTTITATEQVSTTETIVDTASATISEKKVACDVKSVKDTVYSGLGLLGDTLQFEIIDPNNYDKKNLNVLTFKVSEIIKQDDTITDDNEPVPLIVSKDENHIRTYKPESTTKYLESINEENYESYKSRSYHATYEYYTPYTYIDVKTSKGYYDKKCEETTSTKDCKLIANDKTKDIYLNYDINEDEDVNYWRYFIPLNTTTSDSNGTELGFFIRISSKIGEALSTDDCQTILRYYPIRNDETPRPNYTNFITPIPPDESSNIEFKEDYYEGSFASEDMKLFTEQRYQYQCRFSTIVKFNIEQKFYGEAIKKNGDSIIKGYGFYYRPINPNNPFPNEIASDSIWYGLYNNNIITVKDKEDNELLKIDLNDSFDEITYTTKDVSLSTIREENSNYGSWEKMNLDGTSEFVKNLGLRKTSSLDNIYKLGCGPDNLDWEECKE